MSDGKLRFLSADDVRQALPMADAVEAMKTAFRDLSAGKAVAPVRTHMRIPEHGGDALFMPSANPSLARMGVKVVTLFEGNRDQGLPLIQALVMLLDATTGAPLAVINGTSLTALRTGAASGAATDVLARPDASVAAVFGGGVQSRSQLEAVCAVRCVDEARVVDVDPLRAEAFARETSDLLGIPVVATATAAAALDHASIVCTATTSKSPVFDDQWVEPGTHINAVGAYQPNVREVPGQTMGRAMIVVDQIEAALAEAGDLIMAMDEGILGSDGIHAELGDVLDGSKHGRRSDEEVTLFKSVGVAVQDLAAASLAFDNAVRLGIGTELSLGV